MTSQGYTVVVAAFNEGRDLTVSLDRIMAEIAASGPDVPHEVIVVDDGSSDDTPALLEEYSATRPGSLRVIRHAENAGLVAAMRTGCRAAVYETVVFLDADLSYAPEIMTALLEAKAASGASVALASPYMDGGRTENVPADRLAASRIANWILSRCSGGRLSTFTGMVRAYTTAALLELFEKPVVGEFNTWALASLIASDLSVVEVPATLAWPPERRQGARRLTLRQLSDRAWDVVVTAGYLWSACRHSKTLKTGTLVLTFEPSRP
jgi:glycosyltransferase involved in cell wall biosynthesis